MSDYEKVKKDLKINKEKVKDLEIEVNYYKTKYNKLKNKVGTLEDIESKLKILKNFMKDASDEIKNIMKGIK